MSKPKGKRIVKPQDTETQMFDWGTVNWLSEPLVTGTKSFSVGFVVIEVGQGHLRHSHPDAEEVLYVISGEGEQMVGNIRQPISPGMLIHIPPSVDHETLNTGWEPMRTLVIYAPPGAEATLRKLPDVRLFPPGRQPKK
jgi:oxalate decarboxylase/phosphoglucose isomerase-like protein (cupin superfamily)